MAKDNEEKSVDELIKQETAHRITEMQSSNYKFPKRINSADVTAIVGAIIVCLILIILCMTGVIA
ncbi:hypothetical protein HYQ58_1574 [Lactobacillus crispatus]|uniref:hypothetical protein n=1 Tax=Lactobacillus crispatus TaxID=47770 RepID=UPI0018E2B5F9|nr:hypothetical protein [Lactobacillus crispatus]MBI1694362.1 hypothetical protein [Lactobacillus crispatus]